MTGEEANELIERMPYINTNPLMVSNDKMRLEMYNSALNSDDPVEWVRLVKIDHIRRKDKSARKYPSQEEMEIALRAKNQLHATLAMALDIQQAELEKYIENRISESF